MKPIEGLRLLVSYVLAFWLLTIIVFTTIEQTVMLESLYIGEDISELTPNERQATVDNLELGSSDIERYMSWIGRMLDGDFGVSHTLGRPAIQVVGERAGFSLEILVTSILFSILLLVRRVPIKLPAILIDIARSLPFFWVALMLLYIYGFEFDWFPLGGRLTITLSGEASLSDRIQHLVLPVVCLSMYIRSSYVSFVNVTGGEVKRSAIQLRDFFVTHLASIIGISLVIEVIFSWPGLGRMFFNTIVSQDYAVSVALLLIIGFNIIIGAMLFWIIFSAMNIVLTRRTTIDANVLYPQEQGIPPMMPDESGTNQDSFDQVEKDDANFKFPFGKAYRIRLGVLTALILFVLIAPELVGSAPFEARAARSFLPIGGSFEGRTYLLGADDVGRDVFSRLILGSVKSLEVALIAGLLTTIATMGLRVTGLQRIPVYDRMVAGILYGIPWLVLGMFLMSLHQYNRSVLVIIVYLASMGMSVATMRHISTAEHPFSIILSLLGISIASGLLFETTMSYLDLGIQLPIPSLGNMLTPTLRYIRQGPHLLMIPGITIFAWAFVLYAVSFHGLRKDEAK